MDVDQSRQETPAMTFDEVSMERGKKFVKALQELKNLRPQLYSAAEYCDKSYLHSEQMQMVLDNLKDYAIQALVNAVDHLGTVASKLTDLLEQYSLDINAMDLKITRLNQQLATCQVYMDKGGLRQQQLLAIIQTHHKHYILPNTINKKVHFSPHIQTDPRQHIQERPCLFPSGASAAKVLLCHLASETRSPLKGSPHGSMSTEDTKTSGRTFGSFNLLEAEESARMKSTPTSSFPIQIRGVAWLGSPEGSKLLTSFRSFDSPTTQREKTVQTPVRSKSILSALFVKQKTQKLKTGA